MRERASCSSTDTHFRIGLTNPGLAIACLGPRLANARVPMDGIFVSSHGLGRGICRRCSFTSQRVVVSWLSMALPCAVGRPSGPNRSAFANVARGTQPLRSAQRTGPKMADGGIALSRSVTQEACGGAPVTYITTDQRKCHTARRKNGAKWRTNGMSCCSELTNWRVRLFARCVTTASQWSISLLFLLFCFSVRVSGRTHSRRVMAGVTVMQHIPSHGGTWRNTTCRWRAQSMTRKRTEDPRRCQTSPEA